MPFSLRPALPCVLRTERSWGVSCSQETSPCPQSWQGFAGRSVVWSLLRGCVCASWPTHRCPSKETKAHSIFQTAFLKAQLSWRHPGKHRTSPSDTWMGQGLPQELGLCPQQSVLVTSSFCGSCCPSVASPLAFLGQSVNVSAPWRSGLMCWLGSPLPSPPGDMI